MLGASEAEETSAQQVSEHKLFACHHYLGVIPHGGVQS
jgi:hypothetical protein